MQNPRTNLPPTSRTCRLAMLLITLSAAIPAFPQNAPAQSDPAPTPQNWPTFSHFQYQGIETATPGKNQYANPILPGFYPDPSICRVGDDYFLVNSSFAWFPGIPIFKSTDLVNWHQIGHVFDRPTQIKLDRLAVSEGVFAVTIRHHADTFYAITTLVGAGGNCFMTAKNPAGPWSDPVWLKNIDGIDPSLFFDGDKAYIVHNCPPPDNKPLYEGHRAIRLCEFDPQTGKANTIAGKIIVNGGTDLAKKPIWIEGPHLFKRHDFYYLIAAEGGTGPDHSEVVFRSRDVWGPYEPYAGNPILSQRQLDPSRPDPVTCTGHADFVETPAGDWWAVFLASRPYEGVSDMTNLGRETFMLPVQWIDDWPVITHGKDPLPTVVDAPAMMKPRENPASAQSVWSDDFSAKTLGPEWNFLRTPRSEWYTLGGAQTACISSRDPTI